MHIISVSSSTLSNQYGEYIFDIVPAVTTGNALPVKAAHTGVLMFSTSGPVTPYMIMYGGENTATYVSSDMIAVNLLSLKVTVVFQKGQWGGFEKFQGCSVAIGNMMITFGGQQWQIPFSVFISYLFYINIRITYNIMYRPLILMVIFLPVQMREHGLQSTIKRAGLLLDLPAEVA